MHERVPLGAVLEVALPEPEGDEEDDADDEECRDVGRLPLRARLTSGSARSDEWLERRGGTRRTPSGAPSPSASEKVSRTIADVMRRPPSQSTVSDLSLARSAGTSHRADTPMSAPMPAET